MSQAGNTKVVYLRNRTPPVGFDAPNSYHTPQQETPTLLYMAWIDCSRFASPQAAALEPAGCLHQCAVLKSAERNGGMLVSCDDSAVLVRFSTPGAAVRAAVHAQRALESLNHEYAESASPIRARMGIHLSGACPGEAHVAPQLAELAVADGICVSKQVYDSVRNDWQIATRHLGLMPAKNIPHQIRAYLLKPSGITLRDRLHYLALKFINRLRGFLLQ